MAWRTTPPFLLRAWREVGPVICFSILLGQNRVSEVAQSCPTLCDPMDCSLSGSTVHGIFQARVLEWIAISFSRGSSQPRNRTRVSRIAGRRFTVWASGPLLTEGRMKSTIFILGCHGSELGTVLKDGEDGCWSLPHLFPWFPVFPQLSHRVASPWVQLSPVLLTTSHCCVNLPSLSPRFREGKIELANKRFKD